MVRCPIDAEEIRRVLEKVLASDGFQRSKTLSRLLRFLVETSLAGEAEALKESLIALRVFRRDPCDMNRDGSIVRVQARNLRARLE